MIFFRAIWASLQSPAFYLAVFQDKAGGIGFRYLLKLFALCWLVVSVVLMVIIINAKTQPEDSPLMLPSMLLHKLESQFPTITIESGNVKFDGEQPFTITDENTGKQLMVIDTTGTIRDLKNTDAQILLTRNQLKIRYESEEIVYDIPKDLKATIDAEAIASWAQTADAMLPYVPLMMLPFNVLSSVLQFAGRWFLFAGFAYIALKNMQPKVPDCLRLSAYALTPSILLKMAMIASGFQPFGAPHVVIFGVGLLYLYFAVSSVLRQR